MIRRTLAHRFQQRCLLPPGVLIRRGDLGSRLPDRNHGFHRVRCTPAFPNGGEQCKKTLERSAARCTDHAIEQVWRRGK